MGIDAASPTPARRSGRLAHVALDLDLTRPFRSHADLVRLVRAVHAADPHDEAEWVEWKSTLELTSSTGIGTVARHALGMANRRHDIAARTAGGCGYVIVGVEPGNWVGIEAMDPADLDNKLRPYLGDPGPVRDARQIEVDGVRLLVVVVDPPQLGDPIHTLGKAYKNYLAGAIFVRRPGKTEAASPADVAHLAERFCARGQLLAVDVSATPAQIKALPDLEPPVHQRLERERAELLASLPAPRADQPTTPPPGGPSPEPVGIYRLRQLENKLEQGQALTSEEQTLLDAGRRHRLSGIEKHLGHMTRDKRSQEQYRQEVARYIEAARGTVKREVMNDWLRLGLAILRLTVTNAAARTMEKVEVILHLPDGVIPFHELPELEAVKKPRPYGSAPAYTDGLFSSRDSFLVPGATTVHFPNLSAPTVEQRPVPVVRFAAVDLRAEERHELPSIFLLTRHAAGHELELRWDATAHNADGRRTGTLTITVA